MNNNIAVSIQNLTSANFATISRFAQSPEIVEATKNSIEKYFALVQESFTNVAQSNAFTQMSRSLAANYQRFADEYSKGLFGMVSQGQEILRNQVEQGSRRFQQITNASAEVVGAGVEVVGAGVDAANEANKAALEVATEAESKLEQIAKARQGRNQR